MPTRCYYLEHLDQLPHVVMFLTLMQKMGHIHEFTPMTGNYITTDAFNGKPFAAVHITCSELQHDELEHNLWSVMKPLQ